MSLEINEVKLENIIMIMSKGFNVGRTDYNCATSLQYSWENGHYVNVQIHDDDTSSDIASKLLGMGRYMDEYSSKTLDHELD